jgi:NAD dependent epimerase/dehydratase
MPDDSAPALDWRGRSVLVTGAGGFIGSHLVEQLLQRGAKVRAFVRYNSRNDLGFVAELKDAGDRLTVQAGDIRDLDTVRRVAEGVDTIFHLAALVGIPYSYEHVHQVVEVNAIGTLNVMTAGRESGARRIVHTSTSEVYGSALSVPIGEDHPKQPQSPYSASKISADAIALAHYLSFKLPVSICRPFNTYGPRQSDRAIIPALFAQALAKDEITVGNLDPTRDFTFVGDTVNGFIRIAESPACLGQEVNLGTGHEIRIGDLLTKIIQLVGRPVKIKQSAERMRPATSEVQRLCSNNAKAARLAGWSPKVGLEDGLRATLDWIRASSHLYNPDQYRT